MYLISDNNAVQRADSFDEAIEVIANWFEDYPSWGTQEELDDVAIAIVEVEPPASGGLEELQRYADDICDAVATACSVDDFHGHGHYHVRAADRLGLSLTVSAE